MDSALILRKLCDSGEEISKNEAVSLLNSSNLISDLVSELVEKPLYAVWRITALAEIPYTAELKYTKRLIKYIRKNMFDGEGFTLSGKKTDLLPCYNAMLAEAFSKLGFADADFVKRSVNWIKKYQLFERNEKTCWNGKGIQKYGGCLKMTPCYTGVVKSVKALIYYNKYSPNYDTKAEKLIQKGITYIKKHRLYKHLSNEEPINRHMLDISYPQSYQLNIMELLEIMYLTGNINDISCESALNYIKQRKTPDNFWKTDYVYSGAGYTAFDKRGKKGEWITYLLEKYIGGSG